MDKSRLKAIPLFADLNDSDLQVISTFANETSVSEGEVLVREGDFSYDIIAIEEGTADVTRGGEKLATLGPGNFVGEVGVLKNEMRNATVTAATAMRLLTLSTWEVKRMRKMPGVMETLEKTIADRA
ncbi:MAG: family transcriptional regulator, cyclic receptor protein [Solirubrobacteraceae bacterium]|jgi:CRP-like cAMP-binding protein|nr:family transcriptional regulator, cyclic receptor protein [Solirubrobacteraceae bacterium]